MRIAGCGCSLIDFLYARVDFSSPGFQQYLSRMQGDGGLTPGHLVFAAELERFAGAGFPELLRNIVGDAKPDASNVGGPCMVALIGASQLLDGMDVPVAYYGLRGDDAAGREIKEVVSQTPVDTSHYHVRPGTSPFTDVFSDPTHDGGRGERTFVNNIGVAGDYRPEDVEDSFFDADILLFGATALTPRIHDGLTGLLRRGRERGAINVVGTVFDFRNERARPGERWPLGESDESYRLIDLLIADRDEALKLSGASDLNSACVFFAEMGVGALIVTRGPEPVHVFSEGSLFVTQTLAEMPVSAHVAQRLTDEPHSVGDTTGCGDNFVGGVLASLASQMRVASGASRPNLAQAVATGICAGGTACFHLGGTYVEKEPGEKRRLVEACYEAYRGQVGDDFELGEKMLEFSR